MSISITKQGDRIVAGIPDQLVASNRQQLKQKVAAEVDRGERKFLFDFARTGYIDSSGLGMLVSLSKQIHDQGGDLLLANLNADLKALFELTKFDTLFRIGDKDDGLAGRPARLHPKPPSPREGADATERPDVPPKE